MASSSGAGAGTGVDSEGEEQEDPSSSLVYETADAMEDLTLRTNEVDDTLSKEGSDELSEFRAQWQRELGATPSPRRDPAPPAPAPHQQSKEGSEELSPAREHWERGLATTPSPQREPQQTDPLTEEEKAKQLFRQGEELESRGKMYEAIQHYKRAMQINPDVETLLYDSAERGDTPEDEESETEEVPRADGGEEEDEEWVEGEDLLARLQRIQARKGLLCEPDNPEKECQFSWLPYEVVLLILRWVVSAELDAASLERLAAACRGLYVACRDPDIWRAMCIRTWGAECGLPYALGVPGWRAMFVARPRLLLHGCYISKTTYLRCGENSFQDQTYRPWFLVDYYRYLRFFSDGVVLMCMCTTPDEPVACVPQLKSRHRLAAGALAGHYRLQGDQVLIIVKKSNEKKPAQPTHTRFRSRRKETHESHETIFRLELQIRAVRGRGNWQLAWRGYSVSTRRDQWTQFELSPAKFPPFAFSRVRGYTAHAAAPLE
ncbi:F-box only protein 9-like [Choristoneura fumiferana]|uniref:F-box only protein 9-like n=1 Tax=Choristoneura fumiferana TaxID=7141 RepID=UPI003D15B608